MVTLRLQNQDVPTLRGLLHLFACPAFLLLGVWLVHQAPSVRTATAAAVYTLGLAAIFGTSAVYHRGSWSPYRRRRLRQIDHAMIFVAMATTYSAWWIVFLDSQLATAVLVVAWIGVPLGVILKLRWIDAPRWFHWLVFVVFGLSGLAVVPELINTIGIEAVSLLLAGGLLHVLGSVAFVTGRPTLIAGHLEHHEVFHFLVVLGAAVQIAVFCTLIV